MRRFQFAALLCLTACLGAAGFQALAVRRSEARTAADPPAVAWRYQSVRLINEFQIDVKANEQAGKGWEVVQVVPVVTDSGASFSMQYTMLFRRPADVKD
jgi:hypothetical protein